MIHRVLGTAGHIDHGKTALVKQLTGVDTDRLEEEKRRGITIDLGFASLQLDDGMTVGVVDVPGHERFIRNMLAGAGGIDAVLLVVAADESVKPQTSEHFDICRLLGIGSGIVALTKADLVDDDLLAVVREEVEEMVAGSFLEGAPIVPVSSTTGEGLAAVRAALAEVLQSAAVPQRPDFVRLPVDRAFAMRGFGTVVTGTLLSGEIRLGDSLVVFPEEESVRVRKIQVHGQETETALAGQRTALNLGMTSRLEARRGQLLASPERMEVSSLLDARVEVLASARGGIRDQTPIRMHLGTADVGGRIRVLGSRALAAGGSGLAQIRLSRGLAATVGDRFIIRRPSPAETIAGGVIVDPVPRKHRVTDAEVVQRLTPLAGAPLDQRLAALVEEASEEGIPRQALVVRSGAAAAEIDAAVSRLATAGSCMAEGSAAGRVLSVGAMDAIESRMMAVLAGFHRAQPLAAGMSLQELRRRGAPRTSAGLVDALLARLEAEGSVHVEGEKVADARHRITLAPEEEQALERLEAAIREGALDPPAPAAVLEAAAVAPGRREALVRLLQERGVLHQIAAGYLVHRDVLEDLKVRLWERRQQDPVIDVPQFKQLTSTTRRTAIPLLEYLDGQRITVRRGDKRYIPEPPEGRR